jgi:chromosome segregation ATPase
MNMGTSRSNAASQFEALSREESAFRAAAAQADQDRGRIAARLPPLQKEQGLLRTKIREASDALGRFHREHAIQLKEHDRLGQLLTEDRNALEKLAQESDRVETQEMTAKQDFTKEMESLNDDLSELLKKQEDHRFQKLLSLETVQALAEHVKQTNDGSGTNILTDGFGASIDEWIAANNGFKESMKVLDSIKKDIAVARAMALGEQSSALEEQSSENSVRMELPRHARMNPLLSHTIVLFDT